VRRTERVVGAGLLAAAVLWWLLVPSYPNYDAYYHLVWGREILDGLKPSFEAYAAPTQHPLYVAYAALVGLAGEDADRLLVLTTLLCLVALVWGTWRRGPGHGLRRLELRVPALRGARLRRRAVPGARRVGRRA
jgi:hypothetical protein